jgi:hypothetical protein
MHRKETSPRRAICNIDVEHAGPPCHVARDGRGAAAMQFLADCSCRAPSRSSDAPQTTLLTTTGRQPTGRLLESVGMTKLMMVVVAMMGAVAPARESEDVLFRGEMEPVTPAALALQLVTTTADTGPHKFKRRRRRRAPQRRRGGLGGVAGIGPQAYDNYMALVARLMRTCLLIVARMVA